jgi:ABC-type nitrate/sulfonate/bicarbonate transport system ATPase subunit
MRQRAALLRTYLMDNDVVLLDEPFSALDAITRVELRRWFAKMIGELGLSALVITHDVDEAIDLASSAYVLDGNPRKGVVTHISDEIAIDAANSDAARGRMLEALSLS